MKSIVYILVVANVEKGFIHMNQRLPLKANNTHIF